MDRTRLVAAIFGTAALFSAAAFASGIRTQLSLAGVAVVCAGIALWRTLTCEVREEFQEALPRKEAVQGIEVGWPNRSLPRPELQDGEERVWAPGQELQTLIDEAEKKKEERPPTKAAEPPSFSLEPTDETVNLKAAAAVAPVGEVRSLEDVKRLLELDEKVLGIVSQQLSSSESKTSSVQSTEEAGGTSKEEPPSNHNEQESLSEEKWVPRFEADVPYEPASGPPPSFFRKISSSVGRWLFN